MFLLTLNPHYFFTNTGYTIPAPEPAPIAIQNVEEAPLIDAEPNIWDNTVETTDGPLYSEQSETDDDLSSVSIIDNPDDRDEIAIDFDHHTYHWQKTGLAPCSATCSRGN